MSNDAMDRDYRSALYLQSSVERMNEITVDDMIKKAERLEDAAQKLRKAAGYKDADERAKKCEEVARGLREQVANAARNAEAAKKRKLVGAIIAAIGVAAAVIGMIWMFTIIGTDQVDPDAMNPASNSSTFLPPVIAELL